MTYEQTRDFMKEAYIVLERQGKKFALPQVFNCIEALEKQMPKKPKNIKHLKDDILSYSECPCCGEGVNEEMKFCSECGQKLDWGEEE